MAKVAKEMYVDWKNHPITKVVMQEIADAASEAAAILVTRRVEDYTDDQYLRGFIRGIQEIMDLELDFTDSEVQEFNHEL